MSADRKDYSVQLLDSEHNSRMLEILRSAPINAGGLQLCFDKEPNIFGFAKQKCEQTSWAGLFYQNQLIGFGMLGHHKALIHSQPSKVFYYGNVYLDANWRGARLHTRVADVLFGNHISPDAGYGYSVIMLDNQAAQKHIGRQSGMIPNHQIAATLESRTVFIGLNQKESKQIRIRQATHDDIDRIVELLQNEHKNRFLGLVIDKSKFLLRLEQRPGLTIADYRVAIVDDKIVGVCAPWDCAQFKQTRIYKYKTSMLPLTIAHGLLQPMLKLAKLPKTGTPFREMYLTDIAIENRDTSVMRAFLASIHNEAKRKGYHFLIVSSSDDDPLLKATDKYPHQTIKASLVILARNDTDLKRLASQVYLPFVEMATV